MLRDIFGKLLGRLVPIFRPRSELYLFGSSVLWGQGHTDEGKIGPQTAAWIANRLNERVRIHLLAHSGAFLTGDPVGGTTRLHGEVPSPWPSVLEQIRTSPQPRSERVRILIEGGINEVGGGRISNPTTSPEFIASATKAACHSKFKEVLEEVSRRFPEGDIYVIGYYQILADRARGGEVEEMLKQDGVLPGKIEDDDFNIRDRAVGNTREFRESSDQWLRRATDEFAKTHAGRCIFVPSGFHESEGMFGNPALVFNPWTADPMRKIRARHCTIAIARGKTGMHCYFAATGHPNADGIDRYVAQITAAIEAGSAKPT